MANASRGAESRFPQLFATAPNKAQIQELQSLLSFRGRDELKALRFFDPPGSDSRRWDWTKGTKESLLYLHPTKPPKTGSLWIGLKRLLEDEDAHSRIHNALTAFRSDLWERYPEFPVPQVVESWDDLEPVLADFLLAARPHS